MRVEIYLEGPLLDTRDTKPCPLFPAYNDPMIRAQ